MGTMSLLSGIKLCPFIYAAVAITEDLTCAAIIFRKLSIDKFSYYIQKAIPETNLSVYLCICPVD